MYTEQPLIEMSLIDLSYYARRKNAIWAYRTVKQTIEYAVKLTANTGDKKHITETSKRIEKILVDNDIYKNVCHLYRLEKSANGGINK